MAHGLNSVLKRSGNSSVGCKSEGKTGIGSRRIFAPHFKLQVLDSYRNDSDCKGNQRATARKYGIHRRQIQKWLQVENNLRNSVGKCKSVNNSENPEARKCEVALTSCGGHHRQQGDSHNVSVSYIESRVPCSSPGSLSQGEAAAATLSPCTWSSEDNSHSRVPANANANQSRPSASASPLDFSTHSRGFASASPIVANQEVPLVPADPAAPIDLSLKKVAIAPAGALTAPVPAPPLTPPRQLQSPHSLAQPHPDVWDLSTKSISIKQEEAEANFPSPPAFAPNSSGSNSTSKPVKLFKPYLDDVNENNNITQSPDDCHMFPQDITPPPPCCSSTYPLTCDSIYYNNNNLCDIKSEYSYTLHELQPKSYYYSPQIVYQSADYEMGDYCTTYEDISYSHTLTPLKQRHSYSLDFKLSAIDCYYQDSVCRGNQRAVASKYNIHRRQVQKWLKQAEELRQRNENIKQINAVVS